MIKNKYANYGYVSILFLCFYSWSFSSIAEETKKIKLSIDINIETAEELTLSESVRRSLQHNLNIQVQRLDWEIAYWTMKREKDAFVPALVASAERDENERRNTIEESLSQISPFFDEENISYSAAIEGRLPLGTEYRLGYDLRELSNNLTNRSANAPFDSEYVTFAGIKSYSTALKKCRN